MVLPPLYGERVDDIIAELKRAPEVIHQEITQLTRIRSLMRTPWPEEKLGVARADFFRFFAEHDGRRGTSFLETFPQMAGFWEMCREQADSIGSSVEATGLNRWFRSRMASMRGK
jgi:hypothetical protein